MGRGKTRPFYFSRIYESTISLSSFPALKKGTLLAGTSASSPVLVFIAKNRTPLKLLTLSHKPVKIWDDQENKKTILNPMVNI